MKKTTTIKILVQHLDTLPNIVFSLPLLNCIQEQYPKAELHFLTNKIGAEFLISQKIAKNTFIYKKELFYPILKKIKKEHYNLFLSLNKKTKLNLIPILTKIPLKIGPKSILTNLLFNLTVPTNQSLFIHNILKYKPYFSVFNLPFQINTQVQEDPICQHKIKELFHKYLDPKKPNLLFIFTPHTPSPKELTAAISHLTSNPNYNFILSGFLSKSSSLLSINGTSILNLINQLNLTDLISVIYQANLCISSDPAYISLASNNDKPIIYIAPKNAPISQTGPLSDYFKIIRSPFSASLFIKKFQELQNDLSISNYFISEKAKKNYLLKNTIKVVYLLKNQKDYQTKKEDFIALQDQGLNIHPFVLKKSNPLTLLYFLKKENIHIIQTDSNFFLTKLFLKIVFLFLNFKPKPKFIKQKINKYLTAETYLTIYQKHDFF